MKIGSKIALFYTVITVSTITVVVIVFYFFTSRYINNLYDSYLAEKAFLTAQKHWEKDEVDEYSYLEIQQKYDRLLPQAREILLNIDSMPAVNDSLNKYLDNNQQARLFKSLPVSFVYGELRGSALYYPDNEGNFVVMVMADNSYGHDIQRHMLLLSIFLLLMSCILIYFIGRLYANRILRPLQHILKELTHIRGSNLNIRMKTFGNKDELDELIRTLNDMLDRLDIAFQAEKSFISNASHELNNPLTAIQGECEITLLKERSEAEYIEALQRISVESKRLTQLIKHLLFLSRQEKELLQSGREQVDLVVVLRELCLRYPEVVFSTAEAEGSIYITANNHLIGVALQNIIDNARKYSQKQVVVRLEMRGSNMVVEVEDYGIGIPKEEIKHIFHSFYRGSNTREYIGQGIGLSLSMKILAVYGGKITIDSQVNEYTRVTVTF
ncbi:sensor histidine kinase [Bacteroides rodentium]